MASPSTRNRDRDLPRSVEMRSPTLIAKQEELARQRRMRPDTSTLHLTVSGRDAGMLRSSALEREESPQVLAAALLRRVLDEGMIEELMGEMRAEKAAGGQGRRPFGDAGTLTLHQCAVVYQIGMRGGMRGGPGCSLTEADFANLIHAHRQTVCNVISSLVGRRIIVSARPSIRADRVRRLTEIGQAIFEVLAGEADA